MIGIDEERGVVKRLPAPATALPGAMALGASRSEVHARRAARITADELAAATGDLGDETLTGVNALMK